MLKNQLGRSTCPTSVAGIKSPISDSLFRVDRLGSYYQLILFVILTSLLTFQPAGSQPLTVEQVPHGAASLAFVFDITGSMYDDLVQVIEGAAKILATTLARREKPLYNYVLVPFHDPEIGPVIVTTDPDKFQYHLRDIYVQGGGDCPEMTVGAVKKALEVSLPNSFIYVFTDARSKDYYLTEEVLSLIQQKQSQVVFVMTGDCDDPSHEGFKVYEQIASTSSGQVFLLKKSQVNEVLNFVRVAVQSRKVNLLAIDRDRANTHVMDLPVDTKLQEFTVSVSGDNPQVTLWDPRGNQLEVDRGYTELLRLKNVLVVNTKDPPPGTWKLEISSTGPHTIRITGLSSLDFVTRFARRPDTRFEDADYRPIKGIPTHVMINSTHLEHPGSFTKLELVDLAGEQLAEYPISQNPQTRTMYNVSAFVPPDQFFYVKVGGMDDRGYKLQRTTPTAISPKVPTAPDISLPPLTRAFYDTTAVLVCRVDSAIPFSVRWFKDGYPQTNELYFNDLTNVTLEVPRATKFSEGYYSCNATNARGTSSLETFLDVSEPPPQVSVAANVSVIPGNDVVMNCLVFSTVQYNLTWYRPNYVQSIDIDPRITVLNNGSLRIRNVGNPDEGVYICKASNEGGDTEGRSNIRVQVPPLASVKPKRQNFVEGETIQINCTGLGFPQPSVQWQRRGSPIVSPRMHVRGTLLTIQGIRREDEGDYECLVENTAGRNKMSATLNFIETPRITLYEKRVLVASGDTATLFCQADGIPKPTIKWFKGETELQELSFVQITASGELLIFGTQENDAGDYRCVATNPAGTDSAEVTLDVGSEPLVVQAPSNIGADIEGNATLPCSAVGQPKPIVSWRRGDGRPLDESARVRKLPNGALAIRNLRLEDEGLYTCVVKNQFGQKEVSAFLTITGIVRPLIAYTNPFIEVVEGRTLQLSCVVLLGNPKPTVTWLRNGRPLRGPGSGDDGQFTVLNVQKDDEGEYTCLASNVGGNATYLVRVDVQVPPSLVYEVDKDRQTEFSVIQGASVTLPCRVTGEPRPIVTWSKDGQTISATDPHYFITQDGSLEIFSTDAQDTARYRCSAKNVAGAVEKDLSLFVRIGPVIAGPPEEEITLNAGDNVLLPCEVSGEPKPAVYWRKNFIIFRSDSDNTYFTEEGLHIQRAEVSDKGIYECLASNLAGNNSKVITLMVQVPPKITSKGNSDLVVLETRPVVLGCETTGDPQPTVRWKKDNININIFDDDSGYSLEGTGSLRINSAVLSDTGTYTCSAENPAGTDTREIRLTIQAPPELPEGIPTSADIIENNPVILPCPARGTPTPTITWYRDGEEIHRNEIGVIILDDGLLEIQSAKAVDTARYKCVARNVAGNASNAIDLKILVPPKFPNGDGEGGKPEKPTVVVNDTVTFECPVLADPPPLITWFKNGQELGVEYADRVIITNDGRKLTVLRALVTDTARFTCIASNIAGKSSKNFDLEVQVPPQIDVAASSPPDMSVIVSRPLVIDCPVAGIPPPRVTWFKDGRPVNPTLDPNIRTFAEGRRLELLSAKVTDTARFTCLAENSAGSTSKNFDLSVFVPPTVEDADVVARPEVIADQNIRLTCPASGIPRPIITWHKNKEPITVSDEKHVLLEDGWTLELRNAQPIDTARYTCRASNEAGHNEKVFDLRVLIPAWIDRSVIDSTNQKVLINHTTTLRCPARGLPSPTIRWYKNARLLDHALPAQDRIQTFGEGRQLRINTAQLTDTGTYSCVVTNKAGEDSMDVSLDVLVPARIDRFTNLNPTVIANETVIIDCPASGVPPPQVTWMKDRRPVTTETHPHMRSLFDGRQLEVGRAQVTDSGRYTCRAKNEAGQAELDFTLKVHVPPTISNVDVDTRPSVIVNQSTVLNCPASGTPDPEISWLRNGQPVQFEREPHLQLVGNGRQFRIVQAKLTDSGQYTCIATNEAGQAEKNYVLDVLVPPRIDRTGLDVSPSVIKTRSTVLQCPASGVPSPDISWLKGELPLVENSRIKILAGGLQLQVTNSQEEDTAKYTCVATNPAGEDELVYDLSVQLPPTIDESNLVANPKVIVNRTVLLECPVDGLPPPTIKWLIDGQPLRETPKRTSLYNGKRVEILQAQVSDSARYTCIAFNAAGELQRDFNLEVLVPPHLEDAVVDKELTVVQNRTITIDCPVTGTPEPSIMWLKDREPLLDFPYPNLRELANGKRLEVSNAQVTDSGRYSCMATNVAGQVETSYKLIVQVPPVIDGQTITEKISVVVLEAVNLVCKASGSPEPSVTWLRDTEEITSQTDPRIRILDNGGTLQIVNIRVDDGGRYTCRAENQAGSVDKFYSLDVLVPPTINGSGQLHDMKVILQQSLTLPCPAKGFPAPSIQWQKSHRPLGRFGSPSVRIRSDGTQLVIPRAQLLDNGTYTCVASNVAGNVSKDFLVSVLVPPSIGDAPTEVSASVGSRTLLLCESVGLPDPVIAWTKDNEPFPVPGEHHRMHRSGTLEFSSAQVTDSGDYRCIAENEAGSASREVILRVEVPAQISKDGEEEVQVVVGDEIILPCDVKGTPRPTVFWQKGTAIVAEGPGVTILESGSLRLSRSELKDSGVYICIAQNNAGTDTRQLKLDVLVSPTITAEKREFVVLQNRDILLPCRSSGQPRPKITWQKDGVEIPVNSYRYRTIQSGWLVIPVARADDAGVYTCIAMNEAGQESVDMTLVVQVPPRIEETSRILTVRQGETINLPCKATGFPKPNLKWRRNGRRFRLTLGKYVKTENGYLTINDAQPSDTARYRCIATNLAGKDTQETSLRVQVPPSFKVTPKDKEVSTGGRLVLRCEANGIPVPSIRWQRNGEDVPSPPSVNGRSVYRVRSAYREDAGRYTCIAENPAGFEQTSNTVLVKVPPNVVPQGNRAVTVAHRVVLSCSVGGDPAPTILWTKNGRPVHLSDRIQQLSNGSLVIYQSTSSDAGEYKCVASNDAGTSEGTAMLTVRSPPQFKIEPKNQRVSLGDMVTFNCVAEGEPEPTIEWRKVNVVLDNQERVRILPNNSLRIIATQPSDSGLYRCLASNNIGRVLIEATLTVVVHGMWSDWSDWDSCSQSCGEGRQLRTRKCNNPEPSNGGRSCIGAPEEFKTCVTAECPVDGEWGNWLSWEECSVSCGAGERVRKRQCDNPRPQFGGAPCDGDSAERVACNVKRCPIHGNWGGWGQWEPCSVTCGSGRQVRHRSCDSPRPQYGGKKCRGRGNQRQRCVVKECGVDGSWGKWSQWSSCSLSCGGGTHTRTRKCDSPAPQFGGAFCPGQGEQADFCNVEQCPVNGNWSPWKGWGDCTTTCGGGQRKRFRTCTNPPPTHGGRACIGPSEGVQTCNAQPCPINGDWSPWNAWSECSKSCDTGSRDRQRVCRQPRFGGRGCLGDSVQVDECNTDRCYAVPVQAFGNVIGNINGVDFGVSQLEADMIDRGDSTIITGTLNNVPREVGFHLRQLLSVLSPIYWTTAHETEGAYNGYSLTKGEFKREIQVEFTTGEILKMTHVARGIDSQGVLQLDIIVRGTVPSLPEFTQVSLQPYAEDYIQTGLGSLYAHSSRLFRVNGYSLPYAWNHTITYSEDFGTMPYLVQRLFARGLEVEFQPSQEVLRYRMEAVISPGDPSNMCPAGFLLEEGKYCKDVDECESRDLCSDYCHNAPGSYSCSCPIGYILEVDGKQCSDIDECLAGEAQCSPGQECLNTIGSFQCIVRCSDGFRRTEGGLVCEDINECEESPGICSQECTNTVGGYQCSCRHGYQLSGRRRCEDVNECIRPVSPCSHSCQNTEGSYKCSCPLGYILTEGGICRDIDECAERLSNCRHDQQCSNTPGSFQCIDLCPTGFRRTEYGTCEDIDECASALNTCYYNQACENTQGSFRCICPRGYRSPGPGQPCIDIDECREIPNLCSYRCKNTIGNFECLCPPGQVQLADKKSCAGLEFLEPGRVLPRHRKSRSVDKPLTDQPRTCPGNTCDNQTLVNSTCPAGYSLPPGTQQCHDIDECLQGQRCQHNCTNTPGSYRCSCPPGYRLHTNHRTCKDIDECQELDITCGPEKMCFNRRGDFTCIDIPCPRNYKRDPLTNYCVLECVDTNQACPLNSKYADVLQFKTLALPSGIPAYQDLIRLIAYNQYGERLPKTTFTIMENDPKIPFQIRLEKGKGVVFTLRPLEDGQHYRIKVRAQSYDNRRQEVQYQTTFIIHISVSAYPY